MVDLVAQSACADVLPVSIGNCQLHETDIGGLHLIAPFTGAREEVSAALQKSLGVALPPVGTTSFDKDARCIWFGQGDFLLVGSQEIPQLPNAAVIEQSDAWASVTLSGAASTDVLARLVPIDLREKNFPIGATARTLLGHMNISITREGDEAYLILVFRSMAKTLVEEVTQAMEAMAARR